MSNELLSLPSSGGISLDSLPSAGAVAGDIFQYDGAQWQIVPSGNNNPLLLEGVAAPGVPAVDTGVLYKQTGSDGLWWRTDNVAALDITLAAAATTDVAAGLNVFITNPNIPASGNNFLTIQTAINAAELYAIANPTLEQPVVLVAPGVYNEALSISRNIVLMGQGDVANSSSRSVVVDAAALGASVQINNPCIVKNILFRRTVGALGVVGIDAPVVQLGPAWNGSVNDHAVLRGCVVSSSVVAGVSYAVDWSDPAVGRALTLDGTSISCAVNTNALLIGANNYVYCLNGVYGRNGGIVEITGIASFPLLFDKMDWVGSIHLNNGAGGASTAVLLNSTLSSNAASPAVYDSSNFGFFTVSNSQVNAASGPALNLNFNTALRHHNMPVSTITANAPIISGVVSDGNPATLARDLNVFTVNINIPVFGSNHHTIQAAINASATPGGLTPQVILIAPGIYTEDLTVDRHVLLQGVGASTDSYKGDKIDSTIIVATAGHNITYTSTFKDIYFNKVGDITVFDMIIPAGKSVNFKDCMFASPGATAYLFGIDPTAATSSIHFNRCSSFGTDPTALLMNVGANNIIIADDCQYMSGRIYNEGLMFLSRFGHWAYYGYITLAGSGLLSIKDSILTNNTANPVISSAAANTSVTIHNSTVSSAGVNVIDLSGATSVLTYSNMIIRNLGGGNIVNVNGTINNLNNSVAGDDLNVYTVNPNRPLIGRNYHTVQSAITAACAVVQEFVGTTSAGSTTITGISDADNLLLAVGQQLYSVYLDRSTIITAKGNEGGNANTVTISTATTGTHPAAKISIFPSTGMPIVYITPGVYDDNADTTITKPIIVRGANRNGTQIVTRMNIQDTCWLEDLTVHPGAVTAAAVQIDPAVTFNETLFATRCNFRKFAVDVTHYPTCYFFGNAQFSFRPVDCMISSDTTGHPAIYISHTNAALITDCAIVGNVYQRSSNANSVQIVRGSVTGHLRIEDGAIVPPSTSIPLTEPSSTPGALETRLHVIGVRIYSDNDESAIVCTQDNVRVILDSVDLLVNGGGAELYAIDLSGTGCKLVESNTTFSQHPNEAPVNLTAINVVGGSIEHEHLPVTGADLNVYTVNINVPRGDRNFHTIQDAVTAACAVAGEQTIKVTTGAYIEDVSVPAVTASHIILESEGVVSLQGTQSASVNLTIRNIKLTRNGVTRILQQLTNSVIIRVFDSEIDSGGIVGQYAVHLDPSRSGCRTELYNSPITNGGDSIYVTHSNAVVIRDSFGGGGNCAIEPTSSSVVSLLSVFNSTYNGRILIIPGGVPALATKTNLVTLSGVQLRNSADVSIIDITCPYAGITLLDVQFVKDAAVQPLLNSSTVDDVVVRKGNTSFTPITAGSNAQTNFEMDLITNSNSEFIDATESSVSSDLNVYTVNPDRPLINNNFHTIQSAIDAATAGEYTVIMVTPGNYTENLNINKEVNLVGITPQLGRGQNIIDPATENAPVTINGETTINSACTCNGIYFRRVLATQAVVKIGNAWAVGGIKAFAQFISCGFLTESASGIPTEYAVQCIENNGSARRLDFYNCSFKATSVNVESIVIDNSNRILMQDTEVVGRTLLLGSNSYMVQHIGGIYNGFIDGTSAVVPVAKQVAYYAENVRFGNDGAVAATMRMANNLSVEIINCLFNQSAASPQLACVVLNSGGGATDPGEYNHDGKNKFSSEARVRLNGGTDLSYVPENFVP